jgi:hypothetical protein
MITPEAANEVRRLLIGGELSQRDIALRVGVSRGTVQAIASGRRPDYPTGRLREPRDETVPSGPMRRCPTCGGMVQMPCLLCRVRRMRATRGLDRNWAH